MSKYEWAMIMYNTYCQQNDMEQAYYYYNLAQYYKKTKQ